MQSNLPLTCEPLREVPQPSARKASGEISLTRGIVTLACGQAGATAIAIAASPVLTRLYDPDAFGPVALLTSLVATLSVFGTWSYYRAIALTPSPARRRGLFILCCLLAAAMTLVVGLMVAIFGEPLMAAYGQPDMVRYLPIVPVLFLATSLGPVITIGLNRQRRHRTVAARSMIDKGGTAVGQIALGATVLSNAPFGLILGSLFGTVAGALWGIGNVVRELFRGRSYHFRFSTLANLAYRYRKLPGLYTWSQFISSAGQNAPVLMMGLYYPLEVLGFYALAFRILKLPSSLFTNASGQLYYVEAADLLARGESPAKITLELLSLLPRLVALPTTLLLLMGAPLFEIVFGAQWREAGVYAQILAPWVMVTIIGSPFFSLLSATERFGEAFFYTFSLFVIRLGTIFVGGLWLESRETLLIYSIGNLLFWGAFLICVFRHTHVPLLTAGVTVGREYLRAFVLIAPGATLYWVADWEIAGIGLSIVGCVIGAIFYGSEITQLRRPQRDG